MEEGESCGRCLKNFFLFAQVKSISKVPNKNKKPEVDSEAESTGEVIDMRKVKEMKKLKSAQKIKSIIDIDDDLALKMKKEIEEGGEAEESGQGHAILSDESQLNKAGDGKGSIEGVPREKLLRQIDRILKMFNASSLDDIIALCGNPSRGRFTKAVFKLDPD